MTQGKSFAFHLSRIYTDSSRYCASPISGLGTTLAFSAAYKLAGYLQGYITGKDQSPAEAFARYEAEMRPIVDEAQKLVPGMPHLINPETEWGIWVMHSLIGCLAYTRIFFVAAKYFGRALRLGPAAADYVPVEEFGFKKAEEWKFSDKGA